MKNVPPILILAGAVLLFSCKDRPGPAPADTEPTYLNLGAEASYVGIDACKTCHADKYETFVQAQMGRSFAAATLSNSVADFDNPAPVYDPHSDFYYQAFHKEEALFIMEYRLSGRDTVFKRIEQIDYIVGSGQHTNSHIRNVNGYLYQMPLTWYAQDGKWDLPPKFEDGNNTRFDRPIPLQCMTCHNAMPAFVPGSENRYTAVPFGIDCERCHGPGSIHVREKQAGHVVDITTEIDYTIVNPGKLPIDLQFDICQRCHVQGAAVFKDGKSSLDFRPGLPLADVENVFWPRYADSLQQFIMASHPDRLKLSPCFQQSHADDAYPPLTCITCHNPHVSIETLGEDHYRQVCQSCHTPERVNECTEDETLRARQDDNCVACHMPVSGSEDIPHVRITDHFIRNPGRAASQLLSPEEIAAQKKFVRLASLLETAPAAQEVAQGYLTYYEEVTNHPGFLDSAAVYLEKAQQSTSQQAVAAPLIRLWFWQEEYDAIIRLAQTLDEQTIGDPWTLYRIGEAFEATGRSREAIHYHALAVSLAPEHLRFLNKLASAYGADGQLNAALSIFDDILEANPTFDEAFNNRGFTRVVWGDLQGAEEDFLAALALNPDDPSYLGNIASLYFNTNRKAEARPYARRLIELEPANVRYQQLWGLVK